MSPQNNPYADFWEREAQKSAQPEDKNPYAEFWAKESVREKPPAPPVKKSGLLKGIGEFIMNAPKKLVGGVTNFEQSPTGQNITSALEATANHPLAQLLTGPAEAATTLGTGLGGMVVGAGAVPAALGGQLARGEKPDLDKAYEWGAGISNALTYKPKTDMGKTITDVAMSPITAGKGALNVAGEELGVSQEAMVGPNMAFDAFLMAGGFHFLKGKTLDYVKSAVEKGKSIASAPIKGAIKASDAPPEVKAAVEKLPETIEPKPQTTTEPPLDASKSLNTASRTGTTLPRGIVRSAQGDLSTKSFAELSRNSDSVQVKIDAMHDALDKQGVPWEAQNKTPALEGLYNERSRFDNAASNKAYAGAKKILIDELGPGVPGDSLYASLDSILSEGYSLGKDNPVYFMSKYTGKAIENPETLNQTVRGITQLLFAKERPGVDFWAAMDNPGSGLTGAGKEAIVKRGVDIAKRVHQRIADFLMEDSPSPPPEIPTLPAPQVKPQIEAKQVVKESLTTNKLDIPITRDDAPLVAKIAQKVESGEKLTKGEQKAQNVINAQRPVEPPAPITEKVPVAQEMTKAEAKDAGAKFVGDSKQKLVNPKEQKAWLDKKVAEAIDKAPGSQESTLPDNKIVFDVPGDGQFEIINDKPALRAFQAKLKSWPTTKIKIRPSMPSLTPPTRGKLIEMLDEPGESAKMPNPEKGFYLQMEEGPKEVAGIPVDVGYGIDAFYHDGKVTEGQTGLSISGGAYLKKDAAILSAKELIKKAGIDKVRAQIDTAIKGGKTTPRYQAPITGKKGQISQLSGKELKRGSEAGFLTIKDAPERPVSAPVEEAIATTFSLKKHQKLWTDLVDKYSVVDRLVKDFVKEKDIPLDVANDPSMLIRLYAGTPGKAEAKLFKSRFKTTPDGRIVWTGEPLAAIFKDLPEAEKSSFSEYLVKRHVPEVAAKGKETGFDVAESQRFVAANAPRFEARAKRFTDYHNALMDELVDSGLMKAEVRDQLHADYPNYAAMNRVIEDLQQYGHVPSSRNTFLKIPNPIKRQKGSALPVVDPAESAVRLTYEITNAVERQKVKAAIINLRNLSPELAEIIKPIRPQVEHIGDPNRTPHPKTMQREGIVDILENGERHYYQVPPELYKMMGNLDSVSSGWMVRAFAVPARVLRAGATMGPSFAFARNPVRDQLSAFVNAKHGFVPGIDFAKGLFEMVGKGEDYWKWKAAGGEWSMLVSLDRAANQAKLAEVMGKKKGLGDIVRHPIRAAESVSMFGERPTRIGTFKRAKAAGESDLVAARESRDASVDFARRGAETKDISQLYSFLNARLQGTARLAKSFKEHPMESTVKAFVSATIPSVALYLVNKDSEAFKNQPEWKRRMFWLIPIPGTKRFIPIPKGEIGMIFGNTAEHILGYIGGNDPKAISKMAGDFFQAASPIGSREEILPTAFRPGVGIATNYNTFLDRPIEPRGKESLEPGLRYGRNTSETAKALGKKLNLSPTKMDYLVSSQLAEVGRIGLKASDYALGEMGIIPKKSEQPTDIADIPLVGAFVTREANGFGSETVNQFYEALNDLTRFTQSAKFMQKGNDISDVTKYVSRHKALAAMSDSGLMTEMNRASRRLSELRKAEDNVLAAKGASKENKQIALDKLDEEVMKTVVPVMDRYRVLLEQWK